MDLNLRVLLKGKVKQLKKKRSSSLKRGPAGLFRGGCKSLHRASSSRVLVDRPTSILRACTWRKGRGTPQGDFFAKASVTDVSQRKTSLVGMQRMSSESSGIVQERVSSKGNEPFAGGQRHLSIDSHHSTTLHYAQEKARRALDKRVKASRHTTDAFYASFLALRSEPVQNFMRERPSKWVLPITSINEE